MYNFLSEICNIFPNIGKHPISERYLYSINNYIFWARSPMIAYICWFLVTRKKSPAQQELFHANICFLIEAVHSSLIYSSMEAKTLLGDLFSSPSHYNNGIDGWPKFARLIHLWFSDLDWVIWQNWKKNHETTSYSSHD